MSTILRMPESRRRPEPRHWLPLIIVVVLAFAIVVPPLFNIERYQHRIAQNISRSIGRPAHFSHISLHLLPRPGFDLTDFTVDEDPAFGAEPILHSSSVSASVRLLSLWRGRLEIARISLDEPSLNLVRNAAGKWNFASIMTQASHTKIAPTGQLGPGRSLRFPYIEASNARINFKYGDEKQPFSFLNGDFSAWLENPDEWELRFAAEPTRTDLTQFTSNTGLVRIEGSMKRAPALGEVPLNLRADWTHVPLGQIGRLFGGDDTGWRGELNIRSRLTGTPDELVLKTALDVEDLHRVEFAPENTLSYSAKCTGSFVKAEEQLNDLACLMPVGNGQIAVKGTIAFPTRFSSATTEGSKLEVSLLNFPVSTGLDLLRITREKMGRDMTLNGDINGQFMLGWERGRTTASGSATVEQLAMSAPGMSKPLSFGTLQLTALDGETPAPRSGKGKNARGPVPGTPVSLLLAPLKIDLGAASPLLMDGRFDKKGYMLHLGGRAALARLLPPVRSFGVALPGVQSLQPSGEASLDVQVRGPWLLPMDAYFDLSPGGVQAFSSPSGTITLHDASLETPYLAAPLSIKSAQASLLESQIAWSGIAAQYGPVHFTGSFRVPLHCVGVQCTRQFDLAVQKLDLAALPKVIVGDDPIMHALLRRLENTAATWPALHGTIRAAKASLGNMQLQDAVASLDVDGPLVKIDSLDANALDGTLHLSATLDAGPTPAYHLDAQLNQARIESLGQMFGQPWGTGIINIATHLDLTGLSRDELTSSAKGTFHFDWSRGGLHAGVKASVAKGSPFMHFDQWIADGPVQNQGLTLDQSLLTSPDGMRSVAGTIGFNTQLDLKATPAPATDSAATAAADQPVSISGTLAAPEFSDSQSAPQ